MVGTSLESFDFYVFAYFAAFFVGPLFFDPLGEFGATARGVPLRSRSRSSSARSARSSSATWATASGRRTTLLWTVGIMGIATGLIGLLPTYAQAGWLGAVLLILLRIAQGLSLGGEWGGSILLATEHSGPVKRAFYAAIPQLGSPVGSILSAALFIVMTIALPAEEIAAWGWRIPFLLALPLLLVSLYLRWSITETPVFKERRRRGSPRPHPVRHDVRARARAPIAIAIGAALLGIGSYSLMNTYTINYGVEQLGLQLPGPAHRHDHRRAAAARHHPAVRRAGRPGSARRASCCGARSARCSSRSRCTSCCSSRPSRSSSRTMIIGGILPTMAWAALGGLMNDLFPDHFRYSALSFSYAIAATVSGFVPARHARSRRGDRTSRGGTRGSCSRSSRRSRWSPRGPGRDAAAPVQPESLTLAEVRAVRSDPPHPRTGPPDLPRDGRRGSSAQRSSSGALDGLGRRRMPRTRITECAVAAASVDRLDLTGATLADVDIDELRATAVVGRARLRRVRMTGGRIGTLDLGDAELDEVELRGIRIDYLSLGGATVKDLLVADCTIGSLDVPQATLSRVAFDGRSTSRRGRQTVDCAPSTSTCGLEDAARRDARRRCVGATLRVRQASSGSRRTCAPRRRRARPTGARPGPG